jgi:hypothetical protein
VPELLIRRVRSAGQTGLSTIQLGPETLPSAVARICSPPAGEIRKPSLSSHF